MTLNPSWHVANLLTCTLQHNQMQRATIALSGHPHTTPNMTSARTVPIVGLVALRRFPINGCDCLMLACWFQCNYCGSLWTQKSQPSFGILRSAASLILLVLLVVANSAHPSSRIAPAHKQRWPGLVHIPHYNIRHTAMPCGDALHSSLRINHVATFLCWWHLPPSVWL